MSDLDEDLVHLFRLMADKVEGEKLLNRLLHTEYSESAFIRAQRATVHTLRHTYATRCFESDMDYKTISAQLGHASVKTTIDTYVHLIKPKAIREVDKLAKLDQFLE
ncbi:MAG: tyrosine-type recombinase/integrase [Lacrimispora sphenoides]